MNPSHKGKVEKIDEVVRPVVRVSEKVTEMPEPVSQSESERTEETRQLLAQLDDSCLPFLTSWERQTIAELREGKASTPLRLRELRHIVRRKLHAQEA